MKIHEIYSSSFSIYQTNSVINSKPKPGPLLRQENSTGQHDSMEKSVKSITDRVYTVYAKWNEKNYIVCI